MFNKPLNLVYPNLTDEQQKVIRELLVDCYRVDLVEFFRQHFSLSREPKATLTIAQLRQAFIDGSDNSAQVLRYFFSLTERDQCHSIMLLAAQALSTEYSIADAVANETNVVLRQMVLRTARYLHDKLSHAFPNLNQEELLAAIQRDRTVIDGPELARKAQRLKKPH